MPQPFKNKKLPHFPEGIIAVFAHITGLRAQRTLRLALDTGASYCMLPPEKVLATGHVIPTSRDKMVKIFTASGIEYVPLVTIKSMDCLGVNVRNIEVVCHSLSPESPVEGLLGLNFLIHVPAFLEFYRKIEINR